MTEAEKQRRREAVARLDRDWPEAGALLRDVATAFGAGTFAYRFAFKGDQQWTAFSQVREAK